MKRIAFATALSLGLLAAPMAQAASQDQAMATGAVVGGATGAVIGSGSNQAVEGALVGAVFGTIAGALIASNYDEPTYVAPRHVHREREHRVSYVVPAHRQHVHYVAPQRVEHRNYQRIDHRRFDRD